MKNKFFVTLIVILVTLGGCGEENKKADGAGKKDSVLSADEYNKSPETAAAEKGKELLEKHDCKTCHQIENKLVGPSYNEVAAKYEDKEENYRLLADKINKGGAGNWGEVPMSPHPDVKKEDAIEMAKYILSLK